MPKYRVQTNVGTFEVEVAEGGTERDAIAYVQANASRIPRAETSALRDVGGALIKGVGAVAALPGQIAGIVTGDFDNASTRLGKRIEEEGAEIQTAAFREQQRAAAERVAKAEEEGFLSGAGQQAVELFSDPLSFAAGVAEAIPGMIGTGGAGLVGRAAVRTLAREAGEEVAKRAARRGAVAGATAAETGMVAGDAAQTTYERVKAMPDQVIVASPVYREAIAAGETPEQARETAAVSAARRAAAIAAPIALATGPLGIEARILGGDVAGGFVREGVQGLLREGGTEVVQEVGQGVAENIGAQSVDPNVELTEGLGGRAAAGFLLGGGLGAGVGGISGLTGGVENATPIESDTGVPNVSVSGGPVAPVGPDVGLAPTGGGVETGPPTPSVDLANVSNVTIDNDIAIIETNDGNLTTMPVDQWNRIGVPQEPVVSEPVVNEPVAAEPIAAEPVVTEPVATEPVVSEPVVSEPVVSEPIDVLAPSPSVVTEPVSVSPEPPAITEPVATPEPVAVPTPSGPIEVTPPRSPILDTPIEDIEPITPERFAAAETATREIQNMIAGKTMPQVARELANTGTLETTRIIMPRVANILDAFEKRGIKLDIGVQRDGKRGVPYIQLRDKTSGKVRMSRIRSSIGLSVGGIDEIAPGVSEDILSHELIHAVTMSAINFKASFPSNSRVRQAVTDLEKLAAHVGKRMDEDRKSKKLDWSSTYAAYRKHPDEILAWGLTDSNFQNYLKTIPTKTGSAFTDFVRYIGKLLGIPPKDQSALARLIEITDALLPDNQADIDAMARGAGIVLGVPNPDLSSPAIGADLEAASQQPGLTLPKETRRQRISRGLVDRFERMRVIENLAGVTRAAEGFYEAARKFDSRAGELFNKFQRDYFKPIVDAARKAGLNGNDIELYLYARAAPQINSHFEKMEIRRLVRGLDGDTSLLTILPGTNPNFDMNTRGRDWSPDQPRWSHPDPVIDAAILAEYQKTGTKLLSGSAISNEEAFQEYNPVENGNKAATYREIRDKHRAAVKARLEFMVQRGLIDSGIAQELMTDVPDYVPLKGEIVPPGSLSDADFYNLPDDAETMMSGGGAGFSITKTEWQQRRGRDTLPFAPFATFISDTATSIVRGERNRVGQKMMDFFIANPSDQWRVFSETNPPRDSKGRPYYPSHRDENFLVTKRGGKTFYLRINDPLLAKAAKNLNQEQMGTMLRLSAGVTRLLSRSFTTLNPDFFVPNLARDIQSAALNLAADAPGLTAAFMRNVKDTAAFRSALAFEYGRPGSNQKMRDLYEQFKLDGGAVSWVQRETPEEAAKRIQRDLKTINESLMDIRNAQSAKQRIDAIWNPTSRTFGAMASSIENLNSSFENSIRFAAYRAALDVGMTRERAAMIAREATVDFNRRGEAGALLNALYAFFNAGIQGSVRTARALSGGILKGQKPTRTQAALLGIMGTAAMLAAANAGLSEEDDDGKLFWDKIPDYEKERNLIIMHPDGKKYEKIPMPYGFGFFPYLATRFMDAARRGDDMGAVGLDVVNAALGNFSPIQFSGGTIPSSIAKAVTPTLGKPFVELALNDNFMGKPIYNEPFDRGQSYASVARFNTPEGYKELAQFLNDISGGEGKVKGRLDVPAEGIEYLVGFSLGGVSNLARSLYKTAEDGDLYSAPVIRRLIGQPSEGRNVGEFYDREEKARVVNQQMKTLTGEERGALRKQFPIETNPRVQAALTNARSAVRDLNKVRKQIINSNMDDAEKEERLERLRERIDQQYIRFNRVYNEVERATR